MAAGYITAWPQSSLKGILGGAGAIALFGVVRSLINQAGEAESFFRTVLVLIPSFLPSAAFSLPITALLRLGVNWYGDAMSYTGRPGCCGWDAWASACWCSACSPGASPR
ncbi:MAG: hypothetical protein A2W37_11615 [Chloroflexi bacterium RBG_16_63_12]|nr:MAG: hypothetical protein A2W37_11615 [Chloroflexi bacterium RBG_16_63_12]